MPSRRSAVFSGLIWPGAKLAIGPSIGRFNREVARLTLYVCAEVSMAVTPERLPLITRPSWWPAGTTTSLA